MTLSIFVKGFQMQLYLGLKIIENDELKNYIYILRKNIIFT